MRIDLDWMPPSALAILALSFREASHETITPEISEEWLLLAKEVEKELRANIGLDPADMLPKVAEALPHLFKE